PLLVPAGPRAPEARPAGGRHLHRVVRAAGEGARLPARAAGRLSRRQRWRPGTHAVVRPPIVWWTIFSRSAVRASAFRPQRWWNSQLGGKRSESAPTATARFTIASIRARSAATSAADSVAALLSGRMRAW